jgi:hypothetical protein
MKVSHTPRIVGATMLRGVPGEGTVGALPIPRDVFNQTWANKKMYKQLIHVMPVFLVGSACLLGNVSHAQTPNPTGAQTDNRHRRRPRRVSFSSLGDSLKSAIDPKAVRGYFDIAGQRYYWLVDTETGAKQANAVQGQLVPSDMAVPSRIRRNPCRVAIKRRPTAS